MSKQDRIGRVGKKCKALYLFYRHLALTHHRGLSIMHILHSCLGIFYLANCSLLDPYKNSQTSKITKHSLEKNTLYLLKTPHPLPGYRDLQATPADCFQKVLQISIAQM